MKAVTYAFVILSLFWIDLAYKVATKPEPVQYVRLTRIIDARPASYVVPVQECANTCRAKAKAWRTVQNNKGTN